MNAGGPPADDTETGAVILVTAGIGLAGGFALGLLQPLFVVGIGAGIYAGPSYLGLFFVLCVGVALVSGILLAFAGGRDVTLPVFALSGCLAVGMLAGNAFAGNARIGFATPRPPPTVTPAGPGWTTTGTLLTGRGGHSATLLRDGRVLVAGGNNGGGTLTSAELYDPATGSWAPTGSMAEPREGHFAVLLEDGRVLAVGWSGTAELYDPDTGTWTATGSMLEGRRDGAVTLLRDGRVLVTGGRNQADGFATSELYEPATGAWVATDPMAAGRSAHAATMLADGRVLVTGGLTAGSSTGSTSSEVFDPAQETWSPAADMLVPRWGHIAVRLDDGSVFVTGGDMLNGTAEVLDPAGDAWTPGVTIGAILAPQAIPLGDDRILVFGNLGSLMRIDAPEPGLRMTGSTGHWCCSTATLLQDGRILVVGGGLYGRSDRLVDAHLYDPG